MTPFDRFRQLVQDQPDAVAVVTPYRTATFRKMWSRIERSTARLQGEWGIGAGDTIAYLGCGHLDALVMYFAAARCSARLLPLEHAALQAAAAALTAANAVTLVLHDDALPVPADRFTVPYRPLSTLIATPCKHRDSVLEDSAAISLLQWPQDSDPASPVASSLQHRSIAQLAADRSAPAGQQVAGALFDAAVFGPVVLATLLSGQTLQLGAIAA